MNIKSLFYRKPQTLGEGLSRVKKSLGVKASAKDFSIRPGTRSYDTNKGYVSFDTCDFTENHKCLDKGVKSWTDISRLVIKIMDECGNITKKHNIDYCINHDNVGIEVTPYRYRSIAKTQYDYKRISEPTMRLR